MADPDRPFPHDVAVERSLLGALLQAPDLAEHVAPLLPREALYLDRHAEIYRAMLALHQRGGAIDYQTVAAELGPERLAKAGGIAELVALDELLPVSGLPAVRGYVDVILDRWARRRLIASSIRMREAAGNGQPTTDTIAAAARELDEIDRDRAGSKSKAEDLGELLEIWSPESDEDEGPVIRTGLRDLDAKLRGLRRGQLIVAGGTPGSGKSALALQIARYAAGLGFRIRYQALEMSSDEFRCRLISQECGIPTDRLIDRDLSIFERHKASEAALTVRNAIGDRITIEAQSGLTTGQITAAASLQKLRTGLDLLIVDSLGLIYERAENIRVATGQKCEALKTLAMSLEIPVLLVHHLSRAHLNENRPPRMQDFIETASIERDAHAAILLWRPEEHLPKVRKDGSPNPDFEQVRGKAWIIVDKVRNGKTGPVVTAWLGEHMRFYDLDERAAPPDLGRAQEEIPF